MTLKKSVGLVLGCGSSRGWAHIGAIEALEEAKIPIDFIEAHVGVYQTAADLVDMGYEVQVVTDAVSSICG